MKEYRAIFKCRLCGCIYTGGIAGRTTAAASATCACLGDRLIPQAPRMNEIHYCENGDIGIADFQGFKQMEESEADLK